MTEGTSPTTTGNGGAAKAAASPKAAGTPKAKVKKEAAPKTIAGYQLSAQISFTKDKEGKAYGPENNPKRAGSSAHKLFAKYRAGMTVQDFVKAGGRASAIKYDLDHGFITVK